MNSMILFSRVRKFSMLACLRSVKSFLVDSFSIHNLSLNLEEMQTPIVRFKSLAPVKGKQGGSLSWLLLPSLTSATCPILYFHRAAAEPCSKRKHDFEVINQHD